MSFKAYIDNIKAKTGKSPEDFRRLAEARGLLRPGVKTGEIVSWLARDYGLGRGHAMAIVLTLKTATEAPVARQDAVGKHFSGARAHWRPTYDELLARVQAFGPGVSVGPTASYISLLRKGKKFGIVAVTADRMDVGVKLKDDKPSGRFEAAGDWNSMVTHRVRISDPKEMDAQVLARLKEAFAAAG